MHESLTADFFPNTENKAQVSLFAAQIQCSTEGHQQRTKVPKEVKVQKLKGSK